MPEFVLARPDGSTRPVSGYLCAAPPEDAKRYRTGRLLGGARLPPKVDLRSSMTPIEDQRNTNSCVANAVAGAYEYLVKRHLRDEAYDVSRLFIYFNARTIDGSQAPSDRGSAIVKAIESLRSFGACSEETWPFDEEAVNRRPNETAYAEAKDFLVEDLEAMPTDLETWKHCLAEGNPIIFGIKLFSTFDRQKTKGLVPMPLRSESEREDHGGHTMLAVGYSDTDALFIVRNSWGARWGDAGYCYIPYEYVMNEKYNFGDSWVIKRLDHLPADESTWGDTTTVVPNIEHELAAMSDADYRAMLEAMGDVPLETRIALIFLEAADMDGETSDVEIAGVARYMANALEQLGSELSSSAVLKHAKKRLGAPNIVEESVELLGKHLSRALLSGITADVQAVIGEDNLDASEQEFVDWLVQCWQIEYDESETVQVTDGS